MSLRPIALPALTVLLAVGGALWAAGARVGGYETRLATIERGEAVEMARGDIERRETLDRLTRIELALAELRAEQRILHGR